MPFDFARVLPLVVIMILANKEVSAVTLTKSGVFAGLKVEYKVVLPDSFDPTRAYPTVLAFGGGIQSMRFVDIHLTSYWAVEAGRRGYIVISPAAPTDQLFFESSDRIFPEFLDMVLHDYKVQGGRIHIAGSSTGGVSAFHLASIYPRYFLSITAFPGYLNDTTEPMVEALKSMCIYLHVGERDKDWSRVMQQQTDMFNRKGYTARLFVEEDQGHDLDLGSEGIAHLFDDLDAASKGCSK